MANLKVEIRESITLDGDSNYNAYNFQTISGINEVSKRRIPLPTTENDIVTTNTTIGSGTFIDSEVRYIRITNLSKQWPVILTLKNSDNDEFMYRLDKQASFIYSGETDIGTNQSGSGVLNSFQADNAALATVSDMTDLRNITAFASSSGTKISGSDAIPYADYISAGSSSDAWGRTLPATANIELFVASI